MHSSVWMRGDSWGFGMAGGFLSELASHDGHIGCFFLHQALLFYLAAVRDCNLCNLLNINELNLSVMDCEYNLNVSIILQYCELSVALCVIVSCMQYELF